MWDKGVWKVCRARLCLRCQTDMESEYVMRCDGKPARGRCERCGQDRMTMAYRYTMGKKGLEKIGRLDG